MAVQTLGTAGSEFEEDNDPIAEGSPIRYDPEPARDAVRAVLALGFMGLLALALIMIIAGALYNNFAVEDAKQLLEVILAPLIALVGSATGFYYGSKER